MKKCTYCGKEYPDEAVVCAIDQMALAPDSPLPRVDSEVGSESAEVKKEVESPDGFYHVGSFEVFEAGRLLGRFEKAEVRFLVDKIDRRVFIEGGSWGVAGYADSTSIEIFVHEDDREKATKILTADWKV